MVTVPTVEVRVLGPFEVFLEGQPVHIGSPKQRAVLAALALAAGRVVTADELCDLVWDDVQLASPASTLQSLISRLRGALGDMGRDVLRTRDPGWVLDLAPSAVDALRFHDLAAQARRQRQQGDVVAASSGLADALALWRGAALVDLVDAGYLAAQATRLDEARFDAVEDLAEADLAIGHTADALARLEAHVGDNPLRERAWGLLMVALYRLGRQTAALRAFQQLRTILRDELGLEPSPELTAIERRILHHDPGLSGGVSFPVAQQPPPEPVPADPAPEGTEFADYSVIVVEDHDFQRRTVVQLLRSLGVGKVSDAADGNQALKMLQGNRPDIVVCDIDMPGMDGVEFVTRVAEQRLASAVIIASGLDTNVLRAVEAIGESSGLHVLAALEKPLTARLLGAALRQHTRVAREGTNHPSDHPLSDAALRTALADHDLVAQVAPRIDLTTGLVSSAEAGARWVAPAGELLPSSRVEQVAAQHDLAQTYVEQLVRAATGLLDLADRAGPAGPSPARVAVDMSLLPLTDAGLADWLAVLMGSRGHATGRLVCAVDDIALARAPADALKVLTRLRVKGFKLALHHTGAGPGLPRLLERLPLTELQLDRGLVTGASSDPQRHERLDEALSSARALGLPTVASGCDTPADFSMLLALGCAEAQGQFVADPMSAPELMAWALTGGSVRS